MSDAESESTGPPSHLHARYSNTAYTLRRRSRCCSSYGVASARPALGPPTKLPQASAAIQTWGLQLLDAAGFINYEQDDADAYMDPEGRWAKTRNPHNLETEKIHPIFRKDLFRNLKDAGYELILPAILLASAWFDDPTTLNFFYGVWATEQHTSFWDLDIGHCTIGRRS